MPKYQVQTPDGKTLEYDVPDGVTQEQVLAHAQESYGAKPSDPNSVDNPFRDGADTLTIHTKNLKGEDVSFPVPAGADDAAIRQIAARQIGDQRYLDSSVNRDAVNGPAITPNPSDHSALSGLMLGIEKPLDNAAGWLANTAPGRWLDQAGQAIGLPSTAQTNAAHDAERANNDRSGYQMAGNIAGTLPVAYAAGTSALGSLAGNALSGALLSDAKDGAGVARDAGVGAVGGYLGGRLLNGVAGVVAPRLSAAQQALRNAGVQFTPGQLIGGGLQRLEDASTHLPFVGDAITAARNRGLGQYVRGGFNDALSHIGSALPDGVETGHGASAFARRAFNRAYDDALSRTTLVADQQFINDAAAVAVRATDGTLSADAAEQLQRTAQSVVGHRLNTGQPWTGDMVQSAISELRQRAADSADPAYRRAVQDLGYAVRDAAQRSSAPEVNAALDAADAGYARFKVLQRAARNPEDGLFTPAQLQTASRAGDRTMDKRASSENDALLQDYATDGRKVLPSRVGDSGTAFRSGVNKLAALSLGGGAFANPAAAIGIAAGAGAGNAVYSPTGIRLLNNVFARQAGPGAQRAADILRLLAPAAGAGVAGTAVDLLNPSP